MENKETNFEVNLLPVISLLAVVISFLLLTAVWLPIGTMDIKQAIGESSENNEEPSRFSINMVNQNTYTVAVEREGKEVEKRNVSVKSQETREVETIMERLRESYPDIEMAFIQPQPSTKYESLVALLDVLKKLKLKEIGIEPGL